MPVAFWSSLSLPLGIKDPLSPSPYSCIAINVAACANMLFPWATGIVTGCPQNQGRRLWWTLHSQTPSPSGNQVLASHFHLCNDFMLWMIVWHVGVTESIVGWRYFLWFVTKIFLEGVGGARLAIKTWARQNCFIPQCRLAIIEISHFGTSWRQWRAKISWLQQVLPASKCVQLGDAG